MMLGKAHYDNQYMIGHKCDIQETWFIKPFHLTATELRKPWIIRIPTKIPYSIYTEVLTVGSLGIEDQFRILYK